ncbi:hypothetical protein ISS05_02955 [Candidatus Woesearchaeota archaeon]|nr:hypothetical protein [Candidatus Woesearchaeota archaeon]
MIKIKSKYIIVISLILILLISGCKKAECQADSDCTSKTCNNVKCVEKKCRYDIIRNCCGNGMEEATENTKPGNKCTCPADYGTCEGKGKMTINGREYDATYLKYFCNTGNKCVYGVDEADVIETNVVDERDIGFFKLETQTTFNKPFNVLEDKFKFQIKLKDTGEDLVPPVKITNIQLKEGEVLFGEKILDEKLSKVGDSINKDIPVIYRPALIEEERTLSYKLDYEYTRKVKTDRNDDGSWNYKEELVRDSYEKRFSSKVFFVNPGE